MEARGRGAKRLQEGEGEKLRREIPRLANGTKRRRAKKDTMSDDIQEEGDEGDKV